MESSSSSSSPEISHSAPPFDPSFFAYASLDDVLEELSTRFIMNLPDTELTSVERMCFQVEQAHWYYEDFMREANPKLPSLNLKKFISIFFNSCPLLRQWSAEHEQLFNHFMHYKVRVPVCGAIMLNDKWDKCILVKGWKSSAGWGFPKGKINQNEPSHECAAREVAEETGFNISSYIRPEDYIELTIREQRVTLFIVGGIPEDYPFQTRTRKEISKIQWFKLSDLPSWKRNKQVPGKFYLISPFVHPLKEFIRVNKPVRRRQNRRKDGNDSAADLSFQTDIDGEDSVQVQNGDMSQHQPSVSAVDLDRDVHGYSSSSVDNGEPQTPSPQSTEALPITTEIATESKSDFPMDPHFARLLDGLSLSASKPALNGRTKGRSSSVTPTSARGKLPSARSVDETATGTERAPPEQSSSLADTGSSSGVRSPSDSFGSDSSMNTVRLHGMQPTPSTTSLPSLPSDRRLKHLALLESVAQELATSTAPQGPRHLVHPGPPSSVPPVLFNTESAHIPCAPLPSIGINKLAPFVATERPAPTCMNDPFTVRPMTSQALLPPSSARRHGPNTSMHQDSLLSILSHPNGAGHSIGPRRSLQTFGPNNAHVPAPYTAIGPVQPGPNLPPAQAHGLAAQPLRVMPPPPGAFQFNPGPLTAPLANSPRQPHPSFPNYGISKTFDTHRTHSPNAAQLLSLLNSNTSARPTILVADANRHNFSTGGPAAPSN